MAEVKGRHGAFAEELVRIFLENDKTIAGGVPQVRASSLWFGKIIAFVDEQVG